MERRICRGNQVENGEVEKEVKRGVEGGYVLCTKTSWKMAQQKGKMKVLENAGSPS